MKLTHRDPRSSPFYVPPSATVDPAYEAEVRASTERGEREYARRAARLARAEARLAEARAVTPRQAERRRHRRRLADLEAVAELRRAELDQYRRVMTGSPASAGHRGTRSYRPVPVTHGNPIP
jgi:hypothetical protein